jgi:copper homeostasis protein
MCVMERDIDQAIAHGADGIVFGVLTEKGSIDDAACRRLLARAKGKPAVFHRAFDVMKDPEAGLEQIIDLGFRRILTTGRRALIEDGAETVRRTIVQARGRIEILPGGMVPRNVARLIKEIGCEQIHIASFVRRNDPSARGNAEIYFGAALYPPEDSYDVTDRGFVQSVHEASRA